MKKSKNLCFSIKKSENDSRTFQGILVHYNNVDRDGDIISGGAFSESIKNKRVVTMLFNHQSDNPIGSLILSETEEGVQCTGKLYECANGDIAYQLLKDGAIEELSVGFLIDEYSHIDTGLLIKSGTIIEGSIVYLPSNPLAKITNVKNAKSVEGEIKMSEVNLISNQETGEENNVTTNSSNVREESVEKNAMNGISKALNQVNNTVIKSMKSYITTKEATEDFIKCVMDNPLNLESAWLNNLQAKGITNPQMVLPTAIASSITDKIKSGRILPFVKVILGVDSYKVVDEKLNELGSGHNRTGTTKGKKKEQKIEFIEKLITSQYIYKLQVIGKEIRKQDKKGIVYNFIIEELPNRLVKTIEKAIVIGDGLADSSEYKIKSYKPIISDSPYYQTTINIKENGITLENIFNIAPRYLRQGDFVMITTKDKYFDLKGLKNDLGVKVYDHDTVIVGGNKYPTLDGNIIVVEDFMDNHETVDSVFLSINSYLRIKDADGFEKEEGFDIDYNNEKILIESYEGGALAYEHSAVVIQKALSSNLDEN